MWQSNYVERLVKDVYDNFGYDYEMINQKGLGSYFWKWDHCPSGMPDQFEAAQSDDSGVDLKKSWTGMSYWSLKKRLLQLNINCCSSYEPN